MIVESSIYSFSFSKHVLFAYLAYITIFSLSFYFFVDIRPASEVYLLMGVSNLLASILCTMRVKRSKGLQRVSWSLIALVSIYSMSMNFFRYPNNSEPLPPISVFPISILALLLVFLLTWDSLSFSRWRIYLDSIWGALVALAAFWYFAIDPFLDIDGVGTFETVSLVSSPIVIIMLVSLLINLSIHTTGKGLISVVVMFVGLSLFAVGAVVDSLRSLEVLGISKWSEFIWFMIPISAGCISQLEFDLRPSSVLIFGSRVYLFWITMMPVIIGAPIILLTANREYVLIISVATGLIFLAALRSLAISDENSKLSEKLKGIALSDFLTGLSNRRSLLHDLESLNSSYSAGLIYIDLDYFKDINDNHGHEAGDEALVLFAKRLISNVRESDQAYRIGGDEFVVLFNGSDLSRTDLEIYGRRLRKIVSNPFKISQVVASLGMTMGIYLAEETDSPLEILDKADSAMLKAKKLGRQKTAYLKPNGEFEILSYL